MSKVDFKTIDSWDYHEYQTKARSIDRLARSVAFGCHASKLSKLFAQMAVIIESTLKSNIDNRSICLF